MDQLLWMEQASFEAEPYAQHLLLSGLAQATIMRWRHDPKVFGSHLADQPQDLFAMLHGTDAHDCTLKLIELAAVEAARQHVAAPAPVAAAVAGFASASRRKAIREGATYSVVMAKYRSDVGGNAGLPGVGRIPKKKKKKGGTGGTQGKRSKRRRKKQSILIRERLRSSFLASALTADGGGGGGRMQRRSRRPHKGKEQCSTVNSALILLEHYAVTEQTVQLVVDTLREHHINLRSKGPIAAEEINSRRLVDQHFYAEARKAAINPKELNLPRLKFQTTFGIAWSQVLKGGLAYSALDALEKLGLPESSLTQLWGEAVENGRTLRTNETVVGKIVIPKRVHPSLVSEAYICGGDFLAKRGRFTKPGTCTYYFSVEWDPELTSLSWQTFNTKYIGSPQGAPADDTEHSLNALLRVHWRGLGMARPPPRDQPCVHGSLSPLHGMASLTTLSSPP